MNEGFYKWYGYLYYAPNFVSTPTFDLYKEQKDTYTYPFDGWYWFDSENDAYEFYGIERAVEEGIELP